MHSVVVQKTVEIPHLQFLDLVVVPVRATTGFGTDSAEKCGIAAGAAPVVFVDVTVILQRLFQQSRRSTECWTFQLCHSSS